MSSSEPLTPAGRRIVDAAAELFYTRGITAVGVDLIAERSGVTKRTLYNRFGSKDALVAAYLRERDRRWREDVHAAVRSCRDPLEAVTAPFVALERWSGADARGCAFVNALAELPDPEHAAHRVAADQKRWLRDLFAQLAATAACAESETLAAQLFLLHEGILAAQPVQPDTLGAGVALARELVRAAAPRA